MSTDAQVLELKQILGAMIFGANRPLTVKEMRRCLVEVAAESGGTAAVFGEATETNVREAVEELAETIRRSRLGMILSDAGGGYRLRSDGTCGIWLRHLLDIGRPQRLSMPALETLAVIAYRQPISRAEIEGVRGVNVDHVIRMLLEMQLIRIAGRSELPGRPFLYGTTRTFLEHFGLRDLKDLSGVDPMLFGGVKPGGESRKPASRGSEPAPQGEGAAAVASVAESVEGADTGAEGGATDAPQNAVDSGDAPASAAAGDAAAEGAAGGVPE